METFTLHAFSQIVIIIKVSKCTERLPGPCFQSCELQRSRTYASEVIFNL